MPKTTYTIESLEQDSPIIYSTDNASHAENVSMQLDLLDFVLQMHHGGFYDSTTQRSRRRGSRSNPSFNDGYEALNSQIELANTTISDVLKLEPTREIPSSYKKAFKILVPSRDTSTHLYKDVRESQTKREALENAYLTLKSAEVALRIISISQSLTQERFEQKIRGEVKQFFVNASILENLIASGVGLPIEDLKKLPRNVTFDDLPETAQDVILAGMQFVSLFVSIDDETKYYSTDSAYIALATLEQEQLKHLFSGISKRCEGLNVEPLGSHSFLPAIYSMVLSVHLGELDPRKFDDNAKPSSSAKAVLSSINSRIQDQVTEFQGRSFELAAMNASRVLTSKLLELGYSNSEDIVNVLAPMLEFIFDDDQVDEMNSISTDPVSIAFILAHILNSYTANELNAISTWKNKLLRNAFKIQDPKNFRDAITLIGGAAPVPASAPPTRTYLPRYIEVKDPQFSSMNYAEWAFRGMYLLVLSDGHKIYSAYEKKGLMDNADKIFEAANTIAEVRNTQPELAQMLRSWARDIVDNVMPTLGGKGGTYKRELHYKGFGETSQFLAPYKERRTIPSNFFEFLKKFDQYNDDCILPLYRLSINERGQLTTYSISIDDIATPFIGAFIASLYVSDRDFNDVRRFRCEELETFSDNGIRYFMSSRFNPISMFAGINKFSGCCVKPFDAGNSCAGSAFYSGKDGNIFMHATKNHTISQLTNKDYAYTGFLGIYTTYGVNLKEDAISKAHDSMELDATSTSSYRFGPTEIELSLVDQTSASEMGRAILENTSAPFTTFKIPDNLEAFGPFRKVDAVKAYLYKEFFGNVSLPKEVAFLNRDTAFGIGPVFDSVAPSFSQSIDAVRAPQITNTYTDNSEVVYVSKSSLGLSSVANASNMSRMRIDIDSETSCRVTYSNAQLSLDPMDMDLDVLRYMFSWPKGSKFMLTDGRIEFTCNCQNLMGEDSEIFILSNLMFPEWFREPLGDITFAKMVDMRYPIGGLAVNGQEVSKQEALSLA